MGRGSNGNMGSRPENSAAKKPNPEDFRVRNEVTIKTYSGMTIAELRSALTLISERKKTQQNISFAARDESETRKAYRAMESLDNERAYVNALIEYRRKSNLK